MGFVMSSDPVLIAYSAKRSERTGKRSWIRIGRAWPHAKGAGLTVQLDFMPLDGRVVLLELNEKDDRRLLAEAAEFEEERKQRKRAAPPVQAARSVKPKATR